MKNNFRFFAFAFIMNAQILYGQAPQVIPYQAVARDNAGNPIASQSVALRFSIRDGNVSGTISYQELQIKTTNSIGLFTANIGEGVVINGSMATIAWGSGSKFLQVEMDATGGTNFIDMGTQQMLSVPYALNAANGNFEKHGNDISNSNSGNVGINTSSPAASAQLEVRSVSKGFLPPQMTAVQRDSIHNPIAGLIIYCTDCGLTGGEVEFYNGTEFRHQRMYKSPAK